MYGNGKVFKIKYLSPFLFHREGETKNLGNDIFHKLLSSSSTTIISFLFRSFFKKKRKKEKENFHTTFTIPQKTEISHVCCLYKFYPVVQYKVPMVSKRNFELFI